MSKSDKKPYDFSQRDIQKKANNILEKVILELKDTLPDIYWSYRNEEDQDDLGLDMKVELVERITRKTFFIFQLQNKGSGKVLIPLKKTDKRGFISFQVSVTKAKYYYYQINTPLIFVVVDNVKEIVYWHAIQLDEAIEERITLALTNGIDSIQIYIDPSNQLQSDTVKSFLQDAKDSFDEQTVRFNNYLDNSSLIGDTIITIDRSSHILDQTYEAITKYFNEFTIIPPNELLKLYPFKKGNNSINSYDCFKATIDNIDLFQLLDKIKDPSEIEDTEIPNIADYKEKSETIIRTLRRNGIEYVNTNQKKDFITLISKYSFQICNCCRCLYDQFKFLEALKALEAAESGDELQILLKKGYIHYKLGNFITAYKKFDSLNKTAKKERKWIYYFISLYNISHLRVFIQRYCWENPEQKAVLSSISKLNLQNEFIKLQSKKIFGLDLLRWVYEDKFYSKHYYKISQLVQNIEDHYYSQLNAGWNNNKNICELITELSHISSFLNFNFIIYDGFSDFKDLMALVTKGFICSHSMAVTQRSRLDEFDDYLIKHLLVYGDASKIITYYKRYSVDKLVYQSNSKGHSLLLVLLLNLIDNYKHLDECETYIKQKQFYYQKSWNNILCNGLTLFALFDLPSNELEVLSTTIVDLQDSYGVINHDNLKYFISFIGVKAGFFSKATIEKLVDLSIRQSLFHDEEYLDVLTKKVEELFPDVRLTDEQCSTLFLIYGERCPLCNYKHPKSSIIHYFFIAPTDLKNTIKKYVEEQLESNFEPDLYYTATIFEIISYADHLEKFIAYVTPRENMRSFKSIFSGEDDPFSASIDMLVNILFNNGLNTFDSKYDVFRNYSFYYSWLFDLENFNYSLFEPLWILHYPTSIYLRKLKTIPQVKDAIEGYLKKHQSSSLQDIYFNHFSTP